MPTKRIKTEIQADSIDAAPQALLTPAPLPLSAPTDSVITGQPLPPHTGSEDEELEIEARLEVLKLERRLRELRMGTVDEELEIVARLEVLGLEKRLRQLRASNK